MLTVRQAVITELESRYDTGEAIVKELPKTIKEASEIWRSESSENTSDIQDKIGKTLGKYVEYLNSNDSPFSREERRDAASDSSLQQTINAIKPEGLLHKDLRNKKFDTNGEHEGFMKLFTSFMNNVAEKSETGRKEEAKTALGMFPSKQASEYACVGGTKNRILEAERQLDSPQAQALTAGYQEIKEKLYLESTKNVLRGNQVHINPAIDYLMGVDQNKILEVDSFYRTPLSSMSASNVWSAYTSTTNNLFSKTQERILTESQSSITDNDPEKGILIAPARQEQYLKPWGIKVDEVLKSFYDDSYKIKRLKKADGKIENNDELNNRVSTKVADCMSDSLNKYAFGDNTASNVDWLKPEKNNTDIPDLEKLSRNAGKKWVVEQVNKAYTSSSGKIENIEQEAALMVLFIFSEELLDNKPAMVIKALHELGGGGEKGVDNGLEKLNFIKNNDKKYSGIIDRIRDRCEFYCSRSINTEDIRNRGVKEYAEYLKNPEKKSEYLLHAIIRGGGTNEEIKELIGALSETKFYGKDAQGYTPMHHAAQTGKVDAMEFLYGKDATLVNAKNNAGSTPMHHAASYGEVDAMEFLYGKDATLVNAKDAQGSTPMHHAAYNGKVDAMEFLYGKDATLVTAKNNRGYTPMHHAAQTGKVDAVKFLIEKSDASNRDKIINGVSRFDRRTPLSKAVSKEMGDIVRVLLEAGANKDIKDWRGRTALSHAKRKNNAVIQDILGQHEGQLR